MPIKLEVTQEQIVESHKRLNGDVKHVATELNISVPTVYRYLAKAEEDQEIIKGVVSPKDSELKDYVPATDSEIKDYKPRDGYLKALSVYMEKKLPVLLIGEAGTGKTSLARYYAHEVKLPFLEVSCDSLLGFRELLGQINITDGTSHFIEGLFTKFIQEPSIILLDEITALDPGKNFMLHQLLQSREFFIKEAERGKGKTYKLHDGCKIILACNPPNAKYPGTNRLNVALVDRPQIIWIEELTMSEVAKIVPAHPQKERILVFYQDAKKLINSSGFRTTFSLRGVKKIMTALDAGLTVKEAVHHGFLNAVRATSGEEAYISMYGLAKAIFSI